MGKSGSSTAAPKVKATAKAKGKGAKAAKVAGKGGKAAKVKASLTKAALRKQDDKQPLVKVDDRVKELLEEAKQAHGEDSEACCQYIYERLSKLDHSKIWGQHKTAQATGRADPHKAEDKKDKGKEGLLWFLNKKVVSFRNFTQGVRILEVFRHARMVLFG